MGLLNFFRRPPPICDVPALAEFIDGNAAFVAQKGIYEYSRARAGHYSKVLLREPEFQAAAENSRWRAYPLGLAMVSELVEGVLRPYSDDRRPAQRRGAEPGDGDRRRSRDRNGHSPVSFGDGWRDGAHGPRCDARCRSKIDSKLIYSAPPPAPRRSHCVKTARPSGRRIIALRATECAHS